MESAYDVNAPNGASRRAPGDRVILAFRLYQRVQASGDVLSGSAATTAVGRVRSTIAAARGRVQALSGSLNGRVLLKDYRMVMVVERFDQTPELRSHFRYTQGSKYLDFPFAGPAAARGITHFRIQGRTHWRAVTVNGVQVDGDSALKELRQIIDDRFAPRDRNPADLELYFLDLNAPISAEDPFGEFEWLIHPLKNGVRHYMTAQRPYQRFWSLDFAGLRSNRDLAKAEDGFLAGLLSRDTLRSLLDRWDSLSDFADLIDEVFGAVGEFMGLLDDLGNLVETINDYISAATQLIESSVAHVRALFTRIEEIIGRIEEGIDRVKEIPHLVEDQIDLIRQSWSGLVSGDASVGIRAADSAARIRDLLLALSAQPQMFSHLIAGAPFPPQSITIRVPENVTLEQLAHDAGIDPETLIEANQLRYPFILPKERPEAKLRRLQSELSDFQARDQARVDGGGEPHYTDQIASLDLQIAQVSLNLAADPGVIYAGEEIRVPQERRDLVPSIWGIESWQIFRVTGREEKIYQATGHRVTEETRIFGIDLLLNDQGNFEWDGDRQDLKISAALENIARAQARYIRLPLGAMRFAPGVGNFAWEALGGWSGPGTSQLISYSIAKSLQQDPRVRRIRGMRTVSQGGVTELEYDAELLNGREVPDLRVQVA